MKGRSRRTGNDLPEADQVAFAHRASMKGRSRRTGNLSEPVPIERLVSASMKGRSRRTGNKEDVMYIIETNRGLNEGPVPEDRQFPQLLPQHRMHLLASMKGRSRRTGNGVRKFGPCSPDMVPQ